MQNCLEEVGSNSNNTGKGTRDTNGGSTTLLDSSGRNRDVAAKSDGNVLAGSRSNGGRGDRGLLLRGGGRDGSDGHNSGGEDGSTVADGAGGDSNGGLDGGTSARAVSDGDGTGLGDNDGLAALGDGGSLGAVSNVRLNNGGRGDLTRDGDGGNVKVTSGGSTNKGGNGSSSELHFEYRFY